MSVNVIDTIKPKNNGVFPVVEAVDVKVTNTQRLDAALNSKANQSDLATLSATVAKKANQSDLTALSTTVAGKQDTLTTAQQTAVNSGITATLVTQISTNTAAIAGKASASDLAATNLAVSSKADASEVAEETANLQAQINNIVTPVTQDAEVENARVGADSTSYENLKARLDTEQKETLIPFKRVPTALHNVAIDAITDFVIHMKDPSKSVKLKLVYRDYSNVYAVAIIIDDETYNVLNVASSSYVEKSYNEFDLGDVGYGYFVIDWSKVETDTAYWNINTELKQVYKKDYYENPLLPFESVPDSEDNKAVKSIKDFVIHLPDPSKTVLLKLIHKNYAGTYGNVYAVAIVIDGVSYNILNEFASAYTEKSYNPFDLGEAGYGYFIIDWDSLDDETAYTNIGSALKQVFKEDVDQSNGQIEILLPEIINVPVGKEISLEYYNIVNCSNIEDYEIVASVTNEQIQNLGSRLRIVPTVATTVNETLTIYSNGKAVASKSFKIISIADEKPTIKAVFLGDSMTNAGIYISELVNMLGSGKITLYGTRSIAVADSEGTSRTIYHEGRASWGASTYCNEATWKGLSNPFYNNGFDFSYYMTNNPSFSDVTDVFILLGTNDMAGTNITSNFSEICNSIKNYNSSIRIHCMLPPPPVRSGYGFGSRNYFNYMTFKGYMFNTAKKIKTLFDGVAGYSIIPINANLNCLYDFPQTEVAVNSRNPQQITVLNENVHPSNYGYYRFSDAIYCDIIANCQ